MINVLIVHYNTPRLTECLVRSINMHVNDAVIYIFDNSDNLPFTAEFDNVNIIDNTKGQYINFDKWLKHYPNKLRSAGRSNKWGSAKHCYSVEKCMELINDNFILLDSDVLLKQDISDLINEDVVYAGEIIEQPKSTIKRVSPFICFINVKLCKEHDIHFFDDDYMHGLCKTYQADRYDTGAGFYINAQEYPHIDIKTEDYVVHYGHGSWNKKGYIQEFTIEEWLNINKKYWKEKTNNKKVVYTCITGGYDGLIEPKYISDGFDYVCYTDNPNLISYIWDIRPLPEETDELSTIKKQRYVKLNPHRLLSEYELSIWVDGNVSLNGDLNEFVSDNIEPRISVYVPQHPSRNCLYAEERAVLSMKKDVKENTNPQINRYREEGFPYDYGLLQSNILLRMHNNPGCIKLMEDWFNEVKNGSHRDQLSFNYAAWKNEDVHIKYIDKMIYKSKWFVWGMTHKKAEVNHKTKNVENIVINNDEINKKKKMSTNQIILYDMN